MDAFLVVCWPLVWRVCVSPVVLVSPVVRCCLCSVSSSLGDGEGIDSLSSVSQICVLGQGTSGCPFHRSSRTNPCSSVDVVCMVSYGIRRDRLDFVTQDLTGPT